MQSLTDNLWYGNSKWRWLLWPSSLIFQSISLVRRRVLQKRQRSFAVPVVVVGNLTVGGVGKTPLVVALAQAFVEKGLKPGIVSRGYGATLKQFPHQVAFDDLAVHVGDEPLLLARKTACPVVIAPKRCDAVDFLLANNTCDVIISDDGLQHYAMGRQIEIVVIDGLRGLGNGFCLPAGPLREPARRLKQADFVIINGNRQSDSYSQDSSWVYTQDSSKRDVLNCRFFCLRHFKRLAIGVAITRLLKCRSQKNQRAKTSRFEESWVYRMDLQAVELIHLASGQSVSLDCLKSPVAAVAGIGNPKRFFATLNESGISYHPYAFTDHHQFCPQDLQVPEQQVVMTEKDAMKCQLFAADNWYYLSVKALLSETFWQAFWSHQQIKGHLK